MSRLLSTVITQQSPLRLTRRLSASLSPFALPAMKIVPVPVRSDNYAYLLIDDATQTAAAVDPYDVPKVSAAAETLGVKLVAALTTHHHDDHSGGNQAFASKFPDAPIYGGSKQIPSLTHLIKDKDEFTLGDGIRVKCLATPCHTQDSICFHVTDSTANASSTPGASDSQSGVFTGDTLFLGGCGRFFEGTAEEMHTALTYLSTLPDSTLVFNGHEYTQGNAAFALSVEPDNPAVQKLAELAQKHKITAGLTTIGQEKEWNVFMRLGSPTIQTATGEKEEGKVMAALRDMKNKFKG